MVSNVLFLYEEWLLLAFNHRNQTCFLWETQKYVEILNIWIIALHVGILAIFNKFASFTPAVGSLTTFLPEIMVETQKSVQVLKYTENFRRKLPKIAKL